MTSKALQQRDASQRGAAFVELVISMPVLLVVLVGTVDFARVFYTAIELTNAARAGAQFGARTPGASGDNAAMQAAAVASVNISGVTATATHVCQCALANATFPDTVNCDINPPSAACPPPKFRVITVAVTTSAPFMTISPYLSVIPRPLTLSRSAVMRVTE
jgi:Flp pilus assembly protein TadG